MMTNPPHMIHIRNITSPLLLVHSFFDPSTSYVWAEGLRQQIDEAVLVARNGDGHTSYRLAGEASSIIDTYLMELEVPQHNTMVKT